MTDVDVALCSWFRFCGRNLSLDSPILNSSSVVLTPPQVVDEPSQNVSYTWCGSLLSGCICPSCHHGGYRTRDQLLCVSNFQPNLHLYCAFNYFWFCSVLFQSWHSRFSSIPLFSLWRRIHVYAHIKIFNSTALCLSNYCDWPYPFMLTVLSVRV